MDEEIEGAAFAPESVDDFDRMGVDRLTRGDGRFEWGDWGETDGGATEPDGDIEADNAAAAARERGVPKLAIVVPAVVFLLVVLCRTLVPT